MTNQGLFSFDPSALRGSILQAASDASLAKNSSHQKLDKTGYTYLGRSYGMGSAAGLINPPAASPQWFSYNERGVYANASCWHNDSSTFRIEGVANVNLSLSYHNLGIYNTTGFRGDGSAVGEMPIVAYQGMDIVSWQMTEPQNDPSNRSIISIATYPTDEDEWSFAPFNATYCHIDFSAQEFAVLVNNTNKTVQVTPTNVIDWPEYSPNVTHKVQTWMQSFSDFDTTFGGSVLGRYMRLNVNSLQNATTSDDQTFYQGIADFLASCTDDVLVALLSAQLVGANSTVPVVATVAVPAAVIGDERYIIIVLVLNFLVLVVFVTEAIRTGGWRELSSLDVTDLGGVFPGGLRGGTTLKREFGEAFGGDLVVRLSSPRGKYPRILPANASETEELQALHPASPEFGSRADYRLVGPGK